MRGGAGEAVLIYKITVRTLDEAHKQTLRTVMQHGTDYLVQRGSCVGQLRRQLPALALLVEHPETRPLAPVCGPGVLAVATDASIHKYFADYLIGSQVADREDYTYGSRIAPYLEVTAEMLRTTPGTNQATIEIARPSDILLDDPPCLRSLTWNVVDDKLQLTNFWRSWDVHGGLPMNLGGLQLLNEMMAEWAGIESGDLVAYSSGAHVYEHVWGLV